MTTVEFGRLARSPFERLFDALVDPARCERAMVLLLGGYIAMWSLYAVIAKSTQDLHPDMGEMVAWSREITLGAPKHPPLGPWLVRLWFDVFPREIWAYYLFAMILPTVALWIAWRLSARYLSADKRVVGIALLTFIPFYNFLALKFNANTVLTPFWAATTWWFLRSFETRNAGWAVLAGIGAAAAMLGKYWSFVLLAGLGLAALADPRRAGPSAMAPGPLARGPTSQPPPLPSPAGGPVGRAAAGATHPYPGVVGLQKDCKCAQVPPSPQAVPGGV